MVNCCVFGGPLLLCRYFLNLQPMRWQHRWIIPLTHCSTLLYPALLPPHMKPAANSQPVSSLNTTSQTFVYDLPKSEPDLNMQPWDPNYSYTEPEGTGLPVKLPADTNSVTLGKRMTHTALTLDLKQLCSNSFKEQTRHPSLFYCAPKPQLHLFLRDLHSWNQCQITCLCYPRPTRLPHHRNHHQTSHVCHHLLVKVTVSVTIRLSKHWLRMFYATKHIIII